MTDQAKMEQMGQLAQSIAAVAERATKLVPQMAKKQSEEAVSLFSDELGIGKAFLEVAEQAAKDPMHLMEANTRFAQDYFRLAQETWMGAMGTTGGATAAPDAPKEKSADKRFADTDWSANPWHAFVKQSYQLATDHIQRNIESVKDVSPDAKKKVRYFSKQMLDAASPTNFAMTNPAVLREIQATKGENLVKGLKNFMRDLERGKGGLSIAMTDPKAFELGKNVASTPGKVVFETPLMQLLQYEPSTKNVHAAPLLIIPPWINKYYILDLQPKNSFIKWAVDQGFTVFVISWVNPDAKLAKKTFDDYMTEGPLAAMTAMEQATGVKEINLIGYCLGGTLAACMLGVMAAKKDTRIKSVTFFTSLVDFAKPGDLGVFVDEQQVGALEKRMAKRGGFLEGSEMASTFNMLRANDLIWSFYVHNYLMGKDPFPFDLLFWNSDATRMPAAMHTFYLREMYIKNNLTKPGAVTLQGVPIDLSKVKTPAYFISTIEDHIAPWVATYAGPHLLGGANRFVLGGSGHIAGIVNPPAANKYHYWTNSKLPKEPEDWLKTATQHPGSWWTDWLAWVAPHNKAKQVPARKPGSGKLKAIEDAPGRYAKFRLDAQ